MSRLEQRRTRLETLTLSTENKGGPKVFCVGNLFTEEWSDFVCHKEGYELKPLPDQNDNCQVMRMQFVEIE